MQPWSTAMAESLYGSAGFYRRHQPNDHFRTSVSATPVFAAALARLTVHVDRALEHPRRFDLVDVGAGDGSLLVGILKVLPDSLAKRVKPFGVEMRERPPNLEERVQWASQLPAEVTGLIIANELLDNVPCDVVERVSGRARIVLVDARGEESAGPPAGASQLTWLDAWWPLTGDGDRAELGGERDNCWAGVVDSLTRGLALAVDYGHLREERLAGQYRLGTLAGYREGHQVLPVPDGTRDITAHVAMDACAAVGIAAGAQHSELLTQRDALRRLGVNGSLPDRGLAHSDPAEYVRQLSEVSSATELMDPASLGSFWWLLQSKGMPIPTGSDALSG
ncbi:MAG: SAM-dependent methyltransferase [Actinomycetes bacterium]